MTSNQQAVTSEAIKLKIKLRTSLGSYGWTKLVKLRRNLPAAVKRPFLLKEIPLFDYSHSGYPDVYFRTGLYDSNNRYGHENNLKLFSGYSKNIKACIEHGLYPGNLVQPFETKNSGLPGIITFGCRRRRILRRVTSKPIIEIGPYILYAPGLLMQQEKDEIKKAFGRTMLVLPSHSVPGMTAEHNIDDFCDAIDGIARKFEINNILVCLYYKDITIGRAQPYEDRGYTVVSAGHCNDSLFLRRLREYFEIADLTLSNSVGTHIGYSVACGKPHIVVESDLHYSGKKDVIRSLGPMLETAEHINDVKTIAHAFSRKECEITQEQLEIVNEFWGLNRLKTHDCLLLNLKALDELYRFWSHGISDELALERSLNEMGQKYSSVLEEMLA